MFFSHDALIELRKVHTYSHLMCLLFFALDRRSDYSGLGHDDHTRTPDRRQTHHNFVGEIRICSVKIRINPYHSCMH